MRSAAMAMEADDNVGADFAAGSCGGETPAWMPMPGTAGGARRLRRLRGGLGMLT